MNEELRQTFNEYFYYILAGGVVIGLLLGLLPLILGFKRNKRPLGIAAFVLSGIAGAFSPLISLLIIIVSVLFILQKGKSEISPSNDGLPPETSA